MQGLVGNVNHGFNLNRYVRRDMPEVSEKYGVISMTSTECHRA